MIERKAELKILEEISKPTTWECDICDFINRKMEARKCENCLFVRIIPPIIVSKAKDGMDSARSCDTYTLRKHEVKLEEDIWNKHRLTSLSSGIYYEVRVAAVRFWLV